MNIKNTLVSLLYPRKCPFCTKVIDENLLLCPRGEKKLPFIPKHLQPRSFKYIERCYSVFYYRDMVQESILRYKFHNASAYSEIYGHFLRKCIDENQISCDIISWVPLSRKRLRKRGYDQARLLAEECASQFGIKCLPVLDKIRDNKAQSGISDATARKANVKGVYTVRPDANVKDRHVLLLDDVVTTASTASECAKMLKQAGAAGISVLSVAAAFQ